MKKLIICAAALATAFFAGSCQKENFEQAAGGKTVTYTVQLPDVATKAADTDRFIGDGKNVDQLIYEVWKTEAEGDDQLNPTDKTYLMFRKDAELNENGVFSIELDLVNNQNYTILFWAQVEGAGHYNTSDLSTADLKNVQIVNNTDAFDESRAAFFGVDFIKASEPRKSRQTKTLTRPFGQINLATTLKSKDDLGYELTVDGTTVTVARVASTFNVAAQKAVDSDQSYVFSVAAPNKNADTYEEKPITVNGTNYKWISMNYVFVPANQGLVDVEYTIATNHGPVYNKISNIPAQVNYKTNIVGNLLTSKTEYIVDLNNSWAGEYVHEVVTVTSAADLQTAINNAPEATGTETNIKIDVEPNAQGEKILDLNEAFVGLMSTKAGETAQKNYGIQIPANKSIVLDLNGCTLSQKVNCTGSYSMIKNYGKLVIIDSEDNGKVCFEDLSQGGSTTWGSYVVENCTGAELIVENATIEHLGSNNWTDRPTNLPVQNYAGKVTINGGTLKSPSFRSLRDFTAGGEIIINGGKFEGQIWMQGLGNGTSSLTVNGGDFYPTPDYDGSCIYITNGTNDVQVQINDGMFNTKIGCADVQKPGVSGCIKGGTFTTAAIQNTNAALIANGYAAEQNEDDNWVIVPAPVKVDGGYEISNAAQLAYFAKSVNAGEKTYNEGVTIVLTDDIDLEGQEWTPIGTKGNPFKGTFNGNGKTIKNLVITGYNSYVGLFGNTVDGEIKNLVVENANVSGRLYVAVVAGQPYTSKYTNITVKGHVEVNGMAYVGGVCGYNAYGDYTDITVNVDETSYVRGNSVENGKAYRTYVGGVIGFNGEGGHTYKNITSNIDVKGSTIDVGGMFGIAHYGNKFENCVCSGNVEVYAASEAGDAEEIGGIAGVWHNETGYTVSFTNCSFTGTLKANVEGVDLSDNTITGAPYSATGTGKLIIDGAQSVSSAEELVAAIKAGGSYFLLNDVAMTAATYQNVDFTLDGNGHTIRQVDGSTNTYALFDRVTGKLTLKNVKFAGIKGGAALRTIGAEATIENVTIEGAETTQQQGLLRLVGKNTIKNCTFKNNTCSMVITLNFDGANNDPQVVENCVFEGNTCNGTAALYYVKGQSATINGNKFIGNTVNCKDNGATVYMGFQENCVVTNNLFQNNTVNEAAESSRVAGGVFFGYEMEFTGNAFIGNKVTGTNAKANDVCVSTYYTSIDLSGNYWNGRAPIEDVNYFVQHKSDERVVIINDFLKVNPFNN